MMFSNRLRSFALALVACALLVPTVMAATVVSGEDYVLPAGEVVEGNLYAFGQNVRIDGTVKGDLIGAGVKVEVAPEGRVEGDLLAAGQGVVVGGIVAGDVRAAAFTVQIEDDGRVGGELIGAGYSVGVGEGAEVGGDIIVAAAQGLLDGKVSGDVRFAGSGLSIGGEIGGDVDASVDAPDKDGQPDMPLFPMIQVQPPRIIGPGLEVAGSAQIDGKLSYTSPVKVEVPDSAVKVDPDFNVAPSTEGGEGDETEGAKVVEEERSELLSWTIDLVKNYIALVLFAVLFALIAPRALAAGADIIGGRPLPTFGWGVGTAAVSVLLIILLPIVTIALLVFIGVLHIGPLAVPVLATAMVVGTLVTAGTYLLSWFGRVMVGQWIGGRLLSPLALQPSAGRWLSLLLGLLVYAVLVALPWIGLLFKLVLLLLGLGAVMVLAWQWWRGRLAVAEAPS